MIKTIITAATAVFLMMGSAKASLPNFDDWFGAPSYEVSVTEKVDFQLAWADNQVEYPNANDYFNVWYYDYYDIEVPIEEEEMPSELQKWFDSNPSSEDQNAFNDAYNANILSDNPEYLTQEDFFANVWWIDNGKTVTIEGSVEDWTVDNIGTGTPDFANYGVDFTTQDVADAHADGWTGKGLTIKGQANGWSYSSGDTNTPVDWAKSKKHKKLADKALKEYWDIHNGKVSTNEDGWGKAQVKAKFKYHQRKFKQYGDMGSAYIDVFEADNIAPGATFEAPDAGVYTAKLYKNGKANSFVLFDEVKHNGSNPGKRAARSFNADEAAKGALVWHKFSHLSSESLEELLDMASERHDVADIDPDGTFFFGGDDSYINMIDLPTALSPVGNIN